ncbi:hypothetical protein [Xanthomonas oryzae]|uniref:hypothetical protein n=1 Tax=Xanthomonas oryzae TaxID=347 RepID=UPI00059AC071|nr:hypothetical protein [Xanthomonas oryzae]AJQ89585.1 membrane protein [Xanthomonas oryzae pv. oryzicola]AKK62543.1 membrane protein [Xanthomonas oryzae pv. oryzicola]AKN94927.1 membrane protein [Xanthomonas oryzae pv. oryzicola]AKN98651.1 membrane protein [Xanthomonas oryzae pv. oryzicola]AKO02310.1 membrane protein [Xanthomonas oryzae pv. oryzicola]
MDAVVDFLFVVVGCVMVYFSAISFCTYLQTGEILFRARAGSVPMGVEAARWHMGQLLFGALCVAHGASVLRRKLPSVQPPDRRDRSM